MIIVTRGKFLLITLLVLLLDHLAKYRVSTTLDENEILEIIPGYLRISYVHNSGVAFGYLSQSPLPWQPYLLAGLAIVAVVVILIYSSRMPAQRVLLQVALAVTMGGILGNLTDRLLHGSVVDFIDVHINDVFHWPTFNIADSAITIGIALLLIDTMRHPEREVSHEEADPLSSSD